MMQDSIELIDRDYGVVKKDRRLSSNQIKTRKSSYENIKNKWTEFRLSLLNKKLDRLKEEIVTRSFDVDENSRLTGRSENKILSKTTAIARIEEKIKILSREVVPTDYVSNRAIKLKKKMMDNLIYNSGNAYSIGIDKIDEIFADDVNDAMNSAMPIVNNIDVGVTDVAAVSDTSDVENNDANVVSPEVVDAIVNGIKNTDDESLKSADLSEIVQSELNSVDVTPSVDENISSENTSESEIAPIDVNQISDAILNAVRHVEPTSMFDSNPYSNVESNVANTETERVDVNELNNNDNYSVVTNDVDDINVSSDDIKNEVEAALAKLKVDKSEGSNVNFSKYDSDGNINFNDSGSMFSDLSEDTYDVVLNKNDESDVIKSDINVSNLNDEQYDVILNDHKDEYIPGTNIFKPRDRGIYESDDDYVEFLRNYYEAAFAKPEIKNNDSYVPMTQDQILKSRENIEYDKYEKIYADEWQKIKNMNNVETPVFEVPSFKNIFHPVDNINDVVSKNKDVTKFTDDKVIRDYPVVVPERMVPAIIKDDKKASFDSESDGLTFDFSDATVNDVAKAFDAESSIAGFKALSARVKELQEKKKRELQRQQEIQSDALKTEDRAKKVRQDSKRAKEIYDEKMRRLEEYTRMLAEQCSDIENETRVVSDSVEASRRFIQEQEEKAKSFEALNGQIDEILSDDISIHKGRR